MLPIYAAMNNIDIINIKEKNFNETEGWWLGGNLGGGRNGLLTLNDALGYSFSSSHSRSLLISSIYFGST